MYGTVPNVAPTKGGQPVPTSGTVTQTAPGAYHLIGLTPGTSYSVSVCSVGSQTQIAGSDGTVDVTIRGYDSATGAQGAGFDANGSPVYVSWYEGNVNKWASTLVLTAP
jgi:hypothetical protein